MPRKKPNNRIDESKYLLDTENGTKLWIYENFLIRGNIAEISEIYNLKNLRIINDNDENPLIAHI